MVVNPKSVEFGSSSGAVCFLITTVPSGAFLFVNVQVTVSPPVTSMSAVRVPTSVVVLPFGVGALEGLEAVRERRGVLGDRELAGLDVGERLGAVVLEAERRRGQAAGRGEAEVGGVRRLVGRGLLLDHDRALGADVLVVVGVGLADRPRRRPGRHPSRWRGRSRGWRGASRCRSVWPIGCTPSASPTRSFSAIRTSPMSSTSGLSFGGSAMSWPLIVRFDDLAVGLEGRRVRRLVAIRPRAGLDRLDADDEAAEVDGRVGRAGARDHLLGDVGPLSQWSLSVWGSPGSSGNRGIGVVGATQDLRARVDRGELHDRRHRVRDVDRGQAVAVVGADGVALVRRDRLGAQAREERHPQRARITAVRRCRLCRGKASCHSPTSRNAADHHTHCPTETCWHHARPPEIHCGFFTPS